jgi:DNA repair ATPase RecN
MHAYAEVRAAAQAVEKDRQQSLRELNALVTDAATVAMHNAKIAIEAHDLELGIAFSMRALAANNLVPVVAEVQRQAPPRPDLRAVADRATS